MKAVVYNGPRDVSVKNVPDARIEQPNDVIVKITTTNICGSDLHMYEGRTDFKPGGVFGHENTGEVVEVGPGISRIKKGDQVSLSFNIGCGFCKNCEAGLTAYCLTVYPGMAGAAYGFAGMGPFPGGQAEYLRVPYGDFNCLRLPEDAREKQDDYAFMSDIFPTGWHCTRLAGLQPGESIVIYGAGPVGLMAALSAIIQGASKVMVVDRHPDRLALAEQIGCITIDDSKASPVEQVLAQTRGEGADRGCECVGYQCHEPHGREIPNLTINNLVGSARFTRVSASLAFFSPKTLALPTSSPSKVKYLLTWDSSGSKGSQLASGKPTSSITTGTCAISFTPAGQNRPGSFRIDCLSSRHPLPTNILTRATMGGRKSF
jgi:glutathione-independent formaldehyde dehydrogenase